MDLGWIIAALVAISGVWAAMLVVLWVMRPRDVPLRELARLIPDLVRLLRSVITDRSAPLDVRIALIALIVWLLSPIDLIPEFIPVLGPFDDVVMAIVALRYARRRLGLEGLRERWQGTDNGFALLSRVIGGSVRLDS